MSSDRGIVRTTRQALGAVADGTLRTLGCQVLGVSDGMASIDCSGGRQPICARNGDGTLWFATQRGAAVVDPGAFRLNVLAPPVQIEEFSFEPDSARRRGRGEQAPSRTVLGGPFEGGLRVPAGSRKLTIAYTALSLVAPERVRFEVRLDGLDTQWQDAGLRRGIEYYDLRPGEYRFRVRAANNDGVWNEKGAAIEFVVQPFLWQTLWFKIGVGVLLAAGSGSVAWWLAHARQRVRRQIDDRFRLAIEATTSAMVMTGVDGAMVMVNAQMERVFGYERGELVGRRVDMLVAPKMVDRLRALYEECPLREHPGQAGDGCELMGLRKDGNEFPIEISLTRIDSDGTLLILASIVDVSERKRAELEIARQRHEVFHLSRVNMLSELSGSLAHELNQPLTAILSNAQAAIRFLDREEVDLGEVKEILDDIVQQDKRAGEVIHRIRQLLRKGKVEPVPVQIGEVVQEVLRLVRSDLINHGVAVRAELAEDLPIVVGDRVQLQQVLINLVLNGCDAMSGLPAHSRQLVVAARRQGDGHVAVLVSDSGVGIAPEHIASIFQPFFTTKTTGMGLGLAVCRTIISAHGGVLQAANNDGCGATFQFTLPVSAGVAR